MRAQRSSFRKSLLAIFLFIFSLELGLAANLAGQETPLTGSKSAQSAAPARVVKKTEAAPVSSAEQGKETGKGPDGEGPDEIDKRAEWFYKQRSSVNGRLPAGARLKAFEHLQRMMVAEGKLKQRVDGTYAEVMPESGTSTTTWTSIGPTPTLGSIFGPVTGRITTIAVDPSDSTGNTVLIGGAQGGIWRTTNGGQTWTAEGDQNASLAMGSIAFAASQPSTVYAGTGEQASIGFDIYYGAGVLISNDHGQTWKQTCTVASSSCPFIGPYDDLTPFGYFTLGGTRISYVSVNPAHPNMVLVAAQTQFVEGTTEGVYCSDNSGATWTNILPDEMSTFVGFASSSVAYAALGNPFGSSSGAPNGNGIYKATSIGSTCSTIHFARLLSTSLPLQSTMGRIELGIAPSDANTVYASIADGTNGSNTNLGVFVTTDGGTNWSNTQAPDVCQNQCWYDNVVKVDPNNKQIVFFGGGAVTNGGAPSWVVRTKSGGTNWSSVIPNVAPPNAGVPHVDSHAIAFVKLPTGKVRAYLGNDGGIWRTDDAEATSVTWTNLNGSALTLSQFYPAISIHPSAPSIALGGTQDNGTQTYSGTASWADLNICGDGTGTAIDAMVPSTVYILCNGLNLLASFQNGAPNTFNLAVTGINPADNSSFVPPLVVDPNAANTLYAGTSKVYQSVDAGNTWTAISGDLIFGNQEAYLTALAVAPGNSAVVYAGAQNGALFAATNVAPGSATFSQVVGQIFLPGRTITAIAIDPSVPAGTTAYVGFSGFSFVNSSLSVNDPVGQIFKTTDGGATWADVSCSGSNCMTRAATDLPNIPVNDVVVDPDVPGTIYAATDLGVFVGTCTGTPCATWTWSTVGAGLPRVAVLSLKLHEASRTLRAATHGRGVWDIVLNNFSFGAGPHITSLSPTTSGAGGSSLTLTVTGSGLTGGTILFGGAALVGTGTASDTTLSGTVPNSLLTIGTPVITVKNQSNATSNGLKFVVTGGSPTLTSIAPSSTPVQANPVNNIPVTLTGTNFATGSKVFWNGAAAGITATVNSATSIAATLPAALLGPYGSTNDVSVLSVPPGGGQSAAVTFKVAATPPANDNFASAINIATISFADVRDSSGATTEASDPTPGCISQFTSAQGNTGGHPNGAYNTIWYKFTPTFSASLTVDTIGSSYDSTLSIWTGSQGSLVNVACNDDIVSGVNIQSQLANVSLTAGTTYYILVSSFGPPDPNPIALGGKSVLNFLYNGGHFPPPAISSISPTSVNSGGPAFTLTVNGSNFVNGSNVNFASNTTFFGNSFPATFVSTTQLTATIPASAVTLPDTFSVAVVSPAPDFTPSNSVNFTVNVGTYPVPILGTINPSSAIAGSLPFTLVAPCENCASSAVLNFNGVAKPTVVSRSFGAPYLYNVSATISTADISTAGTVQVTVTNPTPGGGPSAAQSFTITQPTVVPTISSISPSSAPAGTSTLITVTGTGFQSGTILNFNGTYLGTNVVSSTQLTTTVFTGQITQGTYPIYVVDQPPAGTSLPFNFTVTAPIVPAIAVAESAVALNSSTGTSQSSTVTVTASGGFSGPVSVSCSSPVPQGVTCTNSPLTIVVPNGSTSATGQLTMSVLATSGTLTASIVPEEREIQAASLLSGRGGKGWWGLSAFVGVGAILLLFLPGRNKNWGVLGLSLVCVLTFAMGCGGGGGGGGGGGPVATVTRETVTNGKVASGNPFNFSVTVTGGSPTGQVQLLEGGTVLATAGVSGGTASFQTSALAVGTHSISAHYQGDAGTLPSSSGILNVTVTGTTTISITTSPAATPPVSPITVTIN